VRSLFRLCSPSSHREARCLSSFLWYCIGLNFCQTILSCSFVSIRPCSVERFAWRALSTVLDASRMLMVTLLSWWSGGMQSYSSPGMLLACLRMRRDGSLRGVDSSASCGQWLNWNSRRWTWAWAVKPRSVYLFMTHVRCSIPICVTLSRMGAGLGLAPSGIFVRPQWGSWKVGLGLVSLLY